MMTMNFTLDFWCGAEGSASDEARLSEETRRADERGHQ